jgi:SAM-dependent methyltransferase
VLAFGDMPLSDGIVNDEQRRAGEHLYSLTVVFCRDCCLMQILETVEPEILFGADYPYYSSFSDSLLQHSRENAFALIERKKLNANSLVVELASNDGYLLKNFQERGIAVLGIDPAPGPAAAAEKIGVPTICDFFTAEMARKLRGEGQRADVVIGNNVMAHIPDLNDFVEGISILLKEDGICVIENPYVKDLIESCEFDTIYHEHQCYHSVTAVSQLFARHGMTLFHVEHLPIHGGSLRYFGGPGREPDETVKGYLADEIASGLTSFEYYRDFGARASAIKQELVRVVTELKASGKRIAAYGAAAKGSTMLNYTGIDHRYLDFVVDRNVHKQGLYMPGVGVKIREPEALLTEMPDYVLILAWNFKDEILKQQAEYSRRGGSWIVPIPFPAILEQTVETAG